MTGAAQFAAVGYVSAGLGWLPILVLTFFLNARHLLYSASLAPRLRQLCPGLVGKSVPECDR